MTNFPRSHSKFADAIDIALWLENDQNTPLQQRLQRDRAIALELDRQRPFARVRQWWCCIQHQSAAGAPASVERPGVLLDRLRGLVGCSMFLLGALSGAALTLTVFRYDGQQPVNVLLVIATLVGLPSMLMLLTLLLMPQGAHQYRIVAGVQDLLAAINPGRLGIWLLERIQSGHAAALRTLGWREARRGAFSRYARWQMLNWSQLSALGFSGASVITAVYLVVFSDLAFGWSTTLMMDSSTLEELVSIVALPWQWLWPQAVPGPELIDGSRFFRLGGSAGGATSMLLPQLLTGWWPFVLMCLLFYALLPRVALFLFTKARLTRAIDALLLEDPRVVALQDRMSTPHVVLSDSGSLAQRRLSGGNSPTETTEPKASDSVKHSRRGPWRQPIENSASSATAATVLVWNQACDGDQANKVLAKSMGMAVKALFAIGGEHSYSSDIQTLEHLCDTQPSKVVVLTKSWEPPLLDLFDLLEFLRERLGKSVSVIIVPIARSENDLRECDLVAWRHAVDRLADPSTYLECIDR